MTTPASGPISFDDLNTEVLRKTSGSTVSLNDGAKVIGYGATDTVSMADMRKVYGVKVNMGAVNYTDGKTYNDTWNGFDVSLGIGSLSTTGTVTGSETFISATTYFNFGYASGTTVVFSNAVSGYRGDELNRVAISNSSLTLSTGDLSSRAITGYNFPSSGSNYLMGFRWA